MALRIYAPASSANISVGFDSLGAAISPINGSLLGKLKSVIAHLNLKVLAISYANCQKNRKKTLFTKHRSYLANV